MLTNRRFLITTVFILVLSLLISACSSGNSNNNANDSKTDEAVNSKGNEQVAATDEKTSIRFSTWYGTGDIEIWEEVIGRFESENPNIKVDFEPVDWGTYWQKLLTQLASKSAPDVIGMHVGLVYGYINKDQLEPLDAFIEGGGHQTKLAQAILDEGQWPKDAPKQYALPWRNTGEPLFVNLTAFEAAGIEYPENGWTMDEFLEAARKLTTGNQYGFRVPSFTGNGGLAAAFGAEPITPDKLQSNYNTPEMLEYKTFMHDLIYKEKVAPNPKDIDGSIDPFISGQVAMTIGGAWNIPTYRNIENFEWDVAPMPSINGISKTRGGPDMISVTKDSKNKEAAWKFIEFAVYDQRAQELLRTTGMPMLNEDVNNDALVAEIAAQKPAHIKLFLDGIANDGIGYGFSEIFTTNQKLEMDADVLIMHDPNADIKKVLETLHEQVNDEFNKIQ